MQYSSAYAAQAMQANPHAASLAAYQSVASRAAADPMGYGSYYQQCGMSPAQAQQQASHAAAMHAAMHAAKAVALAAATAAALAAAKAAGMALPI